MIPLEHLPDEARLWIYVAHRPLPPEAEEALLQHLTPFLRSWKAHGLPVEGTAAVKEGRFLLLAGHVPGGEITGCSMDAASRAVTAAGEAVDIRWLPGLSICYRDARGQVQAVSRGTFRRLVAEGVIRPETPVFNLALTTLGDYRQGKFEQPAGVSWLARLFRIPAPTR